MPRSSVCPLVVVLEAPLEKSCLLIHWHRDLPVKLHPSCIPCHSHTLCVSRVGDFQVLPAFACAHALFMQLPAWNVLHPIRSCPPFMAQLKCHLSWEVSPDTPARIPLLCSHGTCSFLLFSDCFEPVSSDRFKFLLLKA